MIKLKKSKKILFILVVIFTLGTCLFGLYNSMESGLTSVSFQNMKEIPLKEPKSSMVSTNITKTANILDGNARDVMIVGTLAYFAIGRQRLIIFI